MPKFEGGIKNVFEYDIKNICLTLDARLIPWSRLCTYKNDWSNKGTNRRGKLRRLKWLILVGAACRMRRYRTQCLTRTNSRFLTVKVHVCEKKAMVRYLSAQLQCRTAFVESADE